MLNGSCWLVGAQTHSNTQGFEICRRTEESRRLCLRLHESKKAIVLQIQFAAKCSNRAQSRTKADDPRISRILVAIRPSHTLSVPHKMISESPACHCPNGVRGSFAGPLVKSTYVNLT